MFFNGKAALHRIFKAYRCQYAKKSAEAIVVVEYELRIDTAEDSQNNEGLNNLFRNKWHNLVRFEWHSHLESVAQLETFYPNKLQKHKNLQYFKERSIITPERYQKPPLST